MSQGPTRLVVVIKPAADRRRLGELVGWVRWLLPAALLLVAPATIPELPDAEVIQLDCADGYDGPLSVATRLAQRSPG